MIRCIAAIDAKRGIADDHGIPWDLPNDRRYYRERVANQIVLMGRGTYNETRKPVGKLPDYVVTANPHELREGFAQVTDPRKFLREATSDVWVIGGAGLFGSVIDLADELYLTIIDGDYACTKFFPDYTNDFELAGETSTQTENGITYRFTTWRRKQ